MKNFPNKYRYQIAGVMALFSILALNLENDIALAFFTGSSFTVITYILCKDL